MLSVLTFAGTGRAATSCEARKLRAVARKVSCLVAERRRELRGATADFASCTQRLLGTYAALDCPTSGDGPDIGDRVGLLFTAVARDVAGLGRFRDDGTSTSDTATGLVWENKSDGGYLDVHYRDNLYFDPFAFAAGIGMRVPAVDELLSLVDFDLPPPSVPTGFFHCTPGCTYGTCNCLTSAAFWSATTIGSLPFLWIVRLETGQLTSGSRIAAAIGVTTEPDVARPGFGEGIPALGTPAWTCQRAKLRAVAKAVKCTVAERVKVVAGRPLRPARCTGMLPAAFAAAEDAAVQAGGACQTVGNAAAVDTRIDAALAGIAQLLSGVGRFRDNGDGTLTDAHTGLTWEKKGSDPTDPSHYVESTYAEADLPGWLASMQGLGGHADWRIASIGDLLSLVDYGDDPPVPDALDRCEPDCGAVACSCTSTNNVYWSATPFLGASYPWIVSFADGWIDGGSGVTAAAVRAVRGVGLHGSP
jgi:hypothetical protein